ncbi:MAG TPA: protease pro-enzyme activation domain-containing protein, partial [Terriglobales bacterium]
MKNLAGAILLFSMAATAWAAQPDRITSAIDGNQLVVMKGSVSPRAQAKFDRGPADASLKLSYVTMMFKQTIDQQNALNLLLAQQQDPNSPNYHKWLTPEQFGARFGLSSGDIAKVSTWLRSQGFAIVDVARGRNWIAFGGSVAQMQIVFHTRIHTFKVDGDISYANTVPVSIPAALESIVSGFRGFDDFKMYPQMVRRSPNLAPDYTVGGGNFLAPADVATIYDIGPLYSAGTTGTGIKIAIMGQTDVNMTDIQNFRAGFGLPLNNPTPTLVTGCQPPGITGDQGEADLDLEWSGAIAQNASITFVVCDPNDGGVITSLQSAVNNKTASVISMSYGSCESALGATFLNQYAPIIQQANTQGQTIMVSSGDSGAAGCDLSGNSSAAQGLAVNGLATPVGANYGVVAVGGTEFNADFTSPSTYWGTGTTGGSAIQYIPEAAWDDSQAGTAIDTRLSSTGGGASITFTKPAWQKGTGV